MGSTSPRSRTDERPRHRRRSPSRDKQRGNRSRSRSRDRNRHRDERRYERRDRDERRPRRDIKEEPQDRIKKEPKDDNQAVEDKQGPDFKTSGKLLEDTNVFNGVVIKYSEPPEAKKPKKRWRLYVFKGEETLPCLHMHRQSAFLMGKDRKIVDIPLDHPSVSRQHAVFQYRMVKKDGMNKVLPYIIDLGSSNGTYLNNKRIDSQRYYELREKDMLKFGYSSREYVLLHENSKDDESDDDGEAP